MNRTWARPGMRSADHFRGCLVGLAPDQWTDGTSMALCPAESLLESGGFDTGNTVQRALERFERTGEP